MQIRVLALALVVATLVVLRPEFAGSTETASRELWIGDWSGALVVGPNNLELVFHVRESSGALLATMDSPRQGAFGHAADRVRATSDSLFIDFWSIGARFEGARDEIGSVQGIWVQSGHRLQLKLVRSIDAGSSTIARPQDPICPCPYDEIDVRFVNARAGIRLAGTLTVPANGSPAGGLVLVAGSGAQDRDGTIFGHRPLRVIGDRLARRGFVILRFDERGVGESEGSRATATIDTFTFDVEAAFEFLRARPEVNPDEVGILGHSEGSLIATQVANRNDNVAFLVLLGAPGLPGREILAQQTRALAVGQGFDAEVIELVVAYNQRLTQVAASDDDYLESELREVYDSLVDELGPSVAATVFGPPGTMRDQKIESAIAALSSPWMREYVRRNPADAFFRVSVPVLALGGSLDSQVPADVNLSAIENALLRSGNPDAVVRMIPGVNHLFQTAITGSVAEYGILEETIAPAVLDSIASWLEPRLTGGGS